MNGKGHKEDVPTRVVGREFIIIIAVVFSSLSFALGFFVGKNNAEKKAEYLPQPDVKVALSDPQQKAVSLPPQPTKAEGQTVNEQAPLQDKNPPQQAMPLQPVSKTEGTKPSQEHKEQAVDPSKETKKMKGKDASAEPNSKSDIKPAEEEITYTVQLEALKNAAEAHRLKVKYTRKGYKVYITVARNKHKEKIFKVRAGEFKDKKDAEILALRLKKNEGLAAFVTAKND